MKRVVFRSSVTFFYEVMLAVLIPASIFAVSVIHGFGVSTTYTPSKTVPAVAGATTLKSSELQLSEAQRVLVSEINRARADAGLQAVLVADDLQNAAGNRLHEMIRDTYYAHVSPDGRSYRDYLNERYQFSCENLNMSFDIRASNTVQDWLESTAGHKECLLNANVTQIGVDTALFQDETEQYITAMVLSSTQ